MSATGTRGRENEPVAASAAAMRSAGGDLRRGLAITGLAKTFPGVRALQGVDLRVTGGTVHALLGHNGCGKSTLVKTLAGFHHPDPGWAATIDGAPLELGSADAADRAGIRFVHQELGLVSELGAMDNVGLALGYARTRSRLIDWRRHADRTRELLARFGMGLDLQRPLSQVSPVERTAVAIVRAVAGWEPGRGLLVLDEPTAALPAREVDVLFKLIRDIRDSGTPVLLISHRLDEVMSIADHATVMRSGQVHWDGSTEAMSVRKFATMIAGEEVEELERAIPASGRRNQPGERPILQVRGLRGRYLAGIDLDLFRGEILGVAGLLGSGREELPYALAGAMSHPVEGTIAVDGRPLERLDIQCARANGIALVPADRAHESVVGAFSVRENVSLAALKQVATWRRLSPTSDRRFARRWLSAVDADPGVSERPITTLSGGNQQKAVLARWLSVGPRVLAVSEPTAGIDIGARTSIYEEVRRRAEEGLSIVMSSSDAEDLMAVCDRVLVLRDGALVADLPRSELTKSAIIAAMEGAHGEHD